MLVYLLGMPGSGKSFWADKLSRILHIPAFHLDDAIEKNEGKTISEIFTENGEDYFRQKEREVLKSFSSKNNFILSTGGGTPCFFNNMNWMNANGITIWIDESLDIIASRLIKEKSRRPLLANVDDKNIASFLIEMLDKRKVFYVKAKHHLTGESINEKSFLNILSNE